MIHKGLKYFIALLSFVCSLGIDINAQTPGVIDTTFYKGMGADRIVRNGVEMADGSVIIVGDLAFANQRAVKGVAKLNADGSTDYTYNSGGVGTNNYVTSIIKQFSDKVIIGGIFTQYNGVATNRIARLNANGTKDATFTATIGNGYVTGLCMRSDTIADSSFVAVGTFTSVNNTTTNRIARFKYDGTKDATFTPGTGANNIIYAIDRQADGKYIIAGAFTSYNGTSINRIARLNADGTLDTSFDPGTGPNSDIGTICVLPNGKIMISGVYLTAYGSTSITRIAMLNSDGSLCTTFSSGSGLNNNAYKFLLDNDKILVTGGFASYNGASVPFLMRIDTTGTRDSTFVVGTGLDYYGYNIFKGASNNLFIVGQFTKYDNYSRGNIVKISSSGAIQQDFAQNGLLNSEILCASIQSDGKIIVGGAFTKYSDVSIPYVVRLNTDGTLDNTFNTGSGPNTSVSALAIQPDGKIIVGGSFTTFNGSTANDLVRLNTDGSVDNTFSSGTGFSCCGVNKIKVLPSGQIMVSGNFGSYRGVQKYRIVQLNSDGALDNSFTPPLSNLANAGYKDFAIQKDGKIVVVGDFQSVRGVTHYGVFRMDSTGTLDTTFRHGLGKDNYHAINSVVIQEDGKIIVAGGANMSFDGIARSRICRLNIDGNVDLSYNTDDQALPGSGAGAYISSIIPYGTGVICVGNYSGRSMQFVNQNGQYEPNYFNNTGISNYGDYIRAIIKDDARGRLLMYGSYEKLNGQLSLGFTSLANYIDDVRTDKQLCTGVNSVVFFDKNVTFNSGNVFTVQLSNASGSFASPVDIGRDTTDGWGPDSIKVVIP
ncbi:MAG: delta-60 repeat domain-containing protein, partial [Bacteroidetes bacterium]|nr:delta-60 repeat domain-containing protein [Bacteroidota bacterium]